MFLTQKTSGYRGTEQFCSGEFLIVFSHNKFKWSEQTGKPWSEFPAELERKLYACVRHVRLSQMGAWMMGCARIGLQSVTLSGSYGHDGLPCDYETLGPLARAKLVEVPAELAKTFWEGGGHNTSGSEGPAMRAYGLQLLKAK